MKIKISKFNVSVKAFLMLAIFSFAVISCSSDDDGPDDPGNPTTGEKVTYTGTVKAIIDGNCLGCHGNPTDNNAPMSLTTYDEVKAVGSNVAARVASGSMPKNGSLTAAQKKAVADWGSGGFLE